MTQDRGIAPSNGQLFGRQLRRRIRVLGVLIALPIFVALIHVSHMERKAVIDTHTQRAEMVASLFQNRQKVLLRGAAKVMDDFARLPNIRNPHGEGCDRAMEALEPLIARYYTLSVVGSGGGVICGTGGAWGGDNLKNTPYFQRAMQQYNLAIGLGLPSGETGGGSVIYMRPLGAIGSDRMVGVTMLRLSLEWWRDPLAAMTQTQTPLAVLTNAQGVRLSGVRDRDAMVLGDISTRKDWATQKQGVMALSDFGEMGRHIVYSLGLLSEPQIGTVFLHLALPVEAELQAVQTRLWMRLSLMAVAFLVLGQLVMAVTQRTISQPVEGLTREIKGIARNGEGKLTVSDRSVRTVAEFGQISDSFRQMSAERQEARADDQRRLALMSALLDAVPDTYFRVGPQGEILDYRSEDSTNLYLPPEAFMGRLVTDVLPPDLGRDFRRHHKRALATGRTSSWDYAIEVKGKVQYYEARICVVSGGPEAIVIVRNITGRMRADRKLRATEERLDRIIANLPGAVIQRRYDGGPLGKVTFISAKCEEIWGIPARDLQADVSLFGKAHDPDDLPIFYAEREAAFRAGQPFYRRFQITHTSGETRWVDYFSTPPYQHSENGDHYVEAFALDVTREVAAQKRYEREREVSHRAQKSEMIGQLTGGVAHDFNNLLAVIMGNLELLRDDNTNSAQSALINSALSATQRGGDLTRSMLAFARKAPLSPQRIYLNDLVLEQRDWIGRTLPARISLETDLADDLWPIEADTGSTESALLNLILNARDAMEQGGNLRIEAKNLFVEQRIRDGHDADLAPGRYVSLSVSDTGHGIPPEQLSQVFEPFFSTKAPGAGSGLGLSMVMGFMRQSGGTVQVESLPGEGTTFRLVFQAVNEDQDKFQGPARVEVSSGVFAGRRVLIVEDEPDVLTILVNGLRKAGFEVRAAGSGDEAKEIFSKDPEFDLLISDIVMPGRLQGPMLVKELRSIRPDLPVVFLSGYASETLVQEYALRDEDIRLMKPVRRADLLRAAAQALRIQTED